MEECSCVYVPDDGDPVRLLSDVFQKARKGHICDECNRKIEPGEQYRRESFVFEGEFETHKTCMDCQSIRKVMFCEGFYYGAVGLELASYVYEVEGNVSEGCLTLLTPKARNMVCELIEDVWQEKENNKAFDHA